MNNPTPSWDVAVIDGEPQVVVNLAAAAQLAKEEAAAEAERNARLRHAPPGSNASTERDQQGPPCGV